MAQGRRWLQKLIRELLRRLSADYDVERLILFGSYAWGRPTGSSDVDMAVVSPSFRGMDDIERLMRLSAIARHLPTPRPIAVDVVGFTPQEIRKAGHFDLAGEIRERGKVVYRKVA